MKTHFYLALQSISVLILLLGGSTFGHAFSPELLDEPTPPTQPPDGPGGSN
jgi:hypothetical protein